MPLDEFRVEFDNPSRSYFPGQNVTGRVVISTSKEKDTNGLEIKFEGIAKCSWTEDQTETTGEGDQRETRTVTRDISEADTFFSYKIYALGNGQSSTKIPYGQSSYPFNFSLPVMGLPSSYVGQYGEVAYFVEAELKRSWKFDEKIKEKFTVNALVDLNSDARSKEPFERRKEKNFCCFCCASGPVGFIIKLPKLGFLPGELLSPTVELFNQSNRGINKVSMRFVQKAAFRAKGQSKETRNVIQTTEGPGLDPAPIENSTWAPDFKVPAVPPTKLGGCKLIDVDYFLEFELYLSGISINLTEIIPITVGTVPVGASTNSIIQPPQDGGGVGPPGAGMQMPTFQNSFNFGPTTPQPPVAPQPGQYQPQQPYVPQYPTFGWDPNATATAATAAATAPQPPYPT